MVDIIKDIWLFFSTQILGMNWLNDFTGNILSHTGMDINSRLAKSLQFFIYDTIKIVILLCFLIFVISYIQSYFPPERTKVILGKFKGIWANLMGALLGTITPFCSCSSIPLFIGFTNAGLPVGVTFSFLISSPMVDMAAFILLMSIFGIKIAFIYVVAGIFLAVIGGSIIESMGAEEYLEPFVKGIKGQNQEIENLSKKERLVFAYESMTFTFKKVFPYILAGVLIGAAIHNYIPTDLLKNTIGKNNPFAVLLATFIGIPIYADIFGTLPIAEALHAKGVGMGTILSFMMSVTALSLPSIIMLRKVVKTKLLIIFISVVAIGIIIIGYTFNFMQIH